MQVKNFIKRLEQALKEKTDRIENLGDDRDDMVFLESCLTQWEFKSLLTEYKKFRHKEEISSHHKPFCDFLNKRYWRVCGTPAQHAAYSHASAICETLASLLAPYAKRSYTDLLMPDADKNAVNERVSDEEKWNRLRLQLRDGIETREQLVSMVQKIPHDAREKYLKLFSLDELNKIILEDRAFKIAVKEKQAYNGDENHDAAVLYLFTSLYRRRLDARAYESASLFGISLGYTRKQKKDASCIPFDFLIEGGKVADFEAYMKRVAFTDMRGALTQKDSDLGTITSQFFALVNPEYQLEIARLAVKPSMLTR